MLDENWMSAIGPAGGARRLCIVVVVLAFDIGRLLCGGGPYHQRDQAGHAEQRAGVPIVIMNESLFTERLRAFSP